MSTYKLATGAVFTDKDIERECAEYEAETWSGRLERIHVGRQPVSDEPLVTVAVKFPASMVVSIDRQSKNRSDYIRKAVAASLE